MPRLALVVLLAIAPPLHAEVSAWTDEPVALQSLIESAHRANTAGNRLAAARLYCTAASKPSTSSAGSTSGHCAPAAGSTLAMS